MDRAISCYDNQGQPLGEVRVITNQQGNQVVYWEPMLNSPYSTLDAIATPFPHVGEFLKGLVKKGPQAFFNLFQAIDETLWVVDPLGSRDDQNISVLMGRPLALTRARLQFELEGPPYQRPLLAICLSYKSTRLC